MEHPKGGDQQMCQNGYADMHLSAVVRMCGLIRAYREGILKWPSISTFCHFGYIKGMDRGYRSPTGGR